MIKNMEEQKTTANRLAKETLFYSVGLWLEHMYGGGLIKKDEAGNCYNDWENLDNELMKDMFHWISIEDEQLEAMTKSEKKEFVLAMEKHILRITKFIRGK